MYLILGVGLLALAVVAYLWRRAQSKDSFVATLAEKQVLEDGCAILVFLLPGSKHNLELRIGEQLNLRVSGRVRSAGKNFIPIGNGKGSFKVLLIPSVQSQSQAELQISKELLQMKNNETVDVKVITSNFEYMGDSRVRVKSASSTSPQSKKFSSFYLLAQGSKIPIAYQIIKGICEDPCQSKPRIVVFFVGGGLADFVLKNEFEHLEQNYQNIKYVYSLPVRGERQPSIAGMGISSEKVAESFEFEGEETFCIICAEQTSLSVAVERALFKKKVPARNIYVF